MKRLRLDNYREVTVLDTAYEQILRIAKENLVCGKCGCSYTKDFPCVAQNLCLECFQKKYASKKLTYVGELSTNDQGDVTHLFMDPDGSMYYTSTSSEHEPEKSTFQTLMYWGF